VGGDATTCESGWAVDELMMRSPLAVLKIDGPRPTSARTPVASSHAQAKAPARVVIVLSNKSSKDWFPL